MLIRTDDGNDRFPCTFGFFHLRHSNSLVTINWPSSDMRDYICTIIGLSRQLFLQQLVQLLRVLGFGFARAFSTFANLLPIEWKQTTVITHLYPLGNKHKLSIRVPFRDNLHIFLMCHRLHSALQNSVSGTSHCMSQPYFPATEFNYVTHPNQLRYNCCDGVHD